MNISNLGSGKPLNRFFPTDNLKSLRTNRFQFHQNKWISAIYEVGRKLTLPATKMVQHVFVAVKGSGGQDKKKSLYKAIAFLFFSIITLPAIVIGSGIRAMIGRGFGHQGLMIVNAAKPKAKPPVISKKKSLHMGTYNLGGLFEVGSAIINLRPVKERAKEFSDWLKGQKEKDQPLFIGLEEVFDGDLAKIITEETQKIYPYQIHSVGRYKKLGMGLNSGLQFLSKVPILSSKFVEFTNLAGIEKFSSKGVLRVELDLGKGRTAMVYHTHLQAFTKNKKERREQIENIKHMMEKDRKEDLKKGINREDFYFLMGDLNIGNTDDMTGKATGEYDAMMRGKTPLFKKWYDPFLEEHSKEGKRLKGKSLFLNKDRKGLKALKEPEGTIYEGIGKKGKQGWGSRAFGKVHSALSNCRLDYIFKPWNNREKCLGKCEIRHVVANKKQKSGVSDHLFVSAIFSQPTIKSNR